MELTDATLSQADHYDAGEGALYATDALIKTALAAMEGGLEVTTKMQGYAIANTLEQALERLGNGISHVSKLAPNQQSDARA